MMKIKSPILVLAPFLALCYILAAPQTAFADIPAGSTKCPHVRILVPADSAQVEEQFRTSVVPPKENQREALKIALDALPPLVCDSVRRVVFLSAFLPSSPEAVAWVGRSRPDLVNISAFTTNASEERLNVDVSNLPPQPNESREDYERRKEELKSIRLQVWPDVIHSIIHESYHCAAHLLESVGPNPSSREDPWPPSAKQRAKAVLQEARISKGLMNEWERVNEGFTDLGYAESYKEGRAGKLEPPPNGYMTMYAGAEAGEDFAETAAWAVTMPLLERSYAGSRPDVSRWQIGCTKLQEYNGRGVPSALSALYTKLNFLADLQLIREKDIEACVGNGTIGLEETDGNNLSFHKHPSGDLLSTFNTDFKITRTAGMLGFSGWHQMTIDGQTFPALLEIQFKVSENELPRGIYRVDRCNGFLTGLIVHSPALIRRTVEGKKSQSICAYDAFVLVVRATDDFINGSAFIQKVWKFSSPPVPEVKGFPVTIAFSARK